MIESRPRTADGAPNLSAIQQQMLCLVLAGGCASQIAAALGLSVPDLAGALVEVRDGLGVRSTREAVDVSWAYGLLD